MRASPPIEDVELDRPRLGRRARVLRSVHNVVGLVELACLGYLWLCATTGRRDRWLAVSLCVLGAEGTALLAARGCPLGVLQRRSGDDVPMFELWFGPQLAPFAVPALGLFSVVGALLVFTRRGTKRTRNGV